MTAFNQVEPVGHAGAIISIILAWSGFLTPILTLIATIASIIWFVICIWESQTVQHWKNNFVMKHRAKVLAKLKARELKVQARINAMELLRSARVDARDLVATASADAAKLVAHAPVVVAEKMAEPGQP